MRNILIIFILSSSLLFSSFENIKIKFDPNHLRLTSKPERITKLLESLLKTENFCLLTRIIKTEASDFVIPYCNAWKSADNSDLIFKIWNGYYSSIITKEMIKEILLPECVAKSFQTILTLSIQMIHALPNSLLQVKEFPFQLLTSSVLEYVIKKAVYTKPQDPKIYWSSWIVSEEREFNQCPESPIFYKYGWQQISPQEFQNVSDFKADCLIRWLLLESDSNFLKISDEEVLMRTLTSISWKSPKFAILSRRINQRALKSDCISLIEDILSNEPNWNWNLNLLFKVMNFLNPKIILIGDWFIGILSLWQSVLSSLTVYDLLFIDKILQFALFTLQPTFQGVTKLPELFNPSIRSFIERQVYERFKNQIKSFYREYPTFFEHEFTLIPLNIRLTSFLRKKRVFSSYQGRFLLKSEYDMETFKLFGSKEFLLFISDKLRNGVFGLSRTSLNPAQFSFAGKLLSFKSLTRLFLLSVSEMSEWFKKIKINNKDFVIPTPYCPGLFWELFGYFLIQARILNLKIDLIIEKEFFLEMMAPTRSVKYIESLSESYNEQNKKEINILSSNLLNTFTVASIIGITDSSSDDDEPLIDCRSLVFQIYQEGMKFMKEGIDYVLEPAKLTSEELYNFIYKK